jgi:tripartite-type tricarboxylate transporter receptor subunit TctC
MTVRWFHALSAVALALSTSQAGAQSWPERPVRFLIGYTAGGTVDVWARMLSRRWEERFKQPFVVENRPGANATLVTSAVAQAPADGYLISIIAMPTQGRNFQKNVSYDTMTDFEPVTGLSASPLALAINSSLPFRSVKELVDHAKANPGKLNFGAGSTSTTLLPVLMQKVWGITTVAVPYKGQAPALAALVANEVQLNLDGPAALKPMAEAGKIRVLLVTSPARAESFPDVPTAAELGYPELTTANTAMVWARKGFPKEAADKINAATAEILKEPEFVARMKAEAGTPLIGTQAQLWERYLRDARFMAEVAKLANYQPQ